MSHNRSGTALGRPERFTSIRTTGGVDCDPKTSQYPDLHVRGGARIKKKLCVKGDISTRNNIMAMGDASIEGNLLVEQNANILCNLDVGKTLNLGELMVNGNANIDEDLNVGGDANICGDILAKSNVEIVNNLNVGEDLNVIGDANIGGSGVICGNVLMKRNVLVLEDAAVAGNSVVCGDFTVKESANIFNDLNVGSNLAVGCFATIGKDLLVLGNTRIEGNLNVVGVSTMIQSTITTINDNKIVLNEGEPGAGVTLGSSGLEIDRGTLDNYFICYEEARDCTVVGTAGNLCCVAEREDNPTANSLMIWDATNEKLISPGVGTVIDVGCGNIANVQAIFVDQLFGKNSPINVEDSLIIRDNAGDTGRIDFENNVIIGLGDSAINIGSVYDGSKNTTTIIGYNTFSYASSSTMIGRFSYSHPDADYCIGIGTSFIDIGGTGGGVGTAPTRHSITFGTGNDIKGEGSMCIGSARVGGQFVYGDYSVGLGPRHGVGKLTGPASGRYPSHQSVVAGFRSTAGGNTHQSVVIGSRASALDEASQAIAIGYRAAAEAIDEIVIGSDAPTNLSAQAKCWNGQVFQDKDWSQDGFVKLAGIDDSGNIFKTTIDLGNVGIDLEDINCGNIGNVQAIFVDQMFGKNSPINVEDELNITAQGKKITFEDNIIIGSGTLVDLDAGNTVVVGLNSIVYGDSQDGVIIGTSTYSKGNGTVIIGHKANFVYFGGTPVPKDYSISIGSESVSYGVSSIALGRQATVLADSAVVIGSNTSTTIVDSVCIGSGSPTNANAQAKCWDGQVFQDRQWSDTFIKLAGIDASGNIFKTTIDVGSGGNIDLEDIIVDGNLDLQCANLSNVNAIYVDEIMAKTGTDVLLKGNLVVSDILFVSNIDGNSPVTINDTLNVQDDLCVTGNIKGKQMGLTIQDDGTPINANLETRIINFTGDVVTTTSTGNNSVEVNIIGSTVVMDDNATGLQYPSDPSAEGVWHGTNAKSAVAGVGTCVGIGNMIQMTTNGLPARNVVVGYGAFTGSGFTGTVDGVALGANARAYTKSIAVGSGATAWGGAQQGRIAVGFNANAGGEYSIAIGRSAANSSEHGICIGAYSTNGGFGGDFNISLGYGANSSNWKYNMAIGYYAFASGGTNENMLAIGREASVSSSPDATAIGGYTTITSASGATCIGANSSANSSGDFGTALGYGASVTNTNTVALGFSSSASGLSSVAIGNGATASITDGIAIGSNSPTNPSAQASCWNGQVFQDRQWSDGNVRMAAINTTGDIVKANGIEGIVGNISLSFTSNGPAASDNSITIADGSSVTSAEISESIQELTDKVNMMLDALRNLGVIA